MGGSGQYFDALGRIPFDSITSSYRSSQLAVMTVNDGRATTMLLLLKGTKCRSLCDLEGGAPERYRVRILLYFTATTDFEACSFHAL